MIYRCCWHKCLTITNVIFAHNIVNSKYFLEYFGYGNNISFWNWIYYPTHRPRFLIGRKSGMKQFQPLLRCFMRLFLVITFKEFTFHYMLKRDVKIPSSWSFIILSLCFWSVFLSGWDSGKLASWFYIATISGTGSIWAPPGGVLQGFYGSSLKWKVLKSQSGRSKGQKLYGPKLNDLLEWKWTVLGIHWSNIYLI